MTLTKVLIARRAICGCDLRHTADAPQVFTSHSRAARGDCATEAPGCHSFAQGVHLCRPDQHQIEMRCDDTARWRSLRLKASDSRATQGAHA